MPDVPGDRHPCERAAKRFAKRKRYQAMHQRAGHWVCQWVSSRAHWRAGTRYAVCGSPL